MSEKKTRFTGQFFTVPNLLSYLRLTLIPFIVWLYFTEHRYSAAGLMALSAVTDIADGWIARHFKLVTDWGKIIDPIADKLTQVAVAVCLVVRCVPMRYLLALLVGKEIYMGIIGMVFIHKTDQVEGSVWYGKMTTVLFFLCTFVLILFPDLPLPASIALVCTEAAAILLSVVLYTRRYILLYRSYQKR